MSGIILRATHGINLLPCIGVKPIIQTRKLRHGIVKSLQVTQRGSG